MPYTAPVGSFPANGYDLFDMAGNVWEWCNDWYDRTYYGWWKNTCGEPCPNPIGPSSGSRVLRGGGWFNGGAYYCRVAHRLYYGPNSYYGYGGFRVVLPD